MSKYKSNQCPECGCEDFTQQEQFSTLYTFESIGTERKHFEQFDSPEFVGSMECPMECKDCEAKINEIKSEEQGKIILADTNPEDPPNIPV